MKGKAAVATCTARGRKLRSWSSEQGATVKREGISFPHAAQHNMIEEIHCAGCGVAIQTEDTKAPGYAPKSALDREMVICQRCFKLKHYNQIQDVSLSDDDFVKILDGIGQKMHLSLKSLISSILMEAGYRDYIGSSVKTTSYSLGTKPIYYRSH